MTTWHLHIKGLVQGVGFRPYVDLVAKEYSLKGTVKNDVDGVHVTFNADRSIAEAFTNRITVSSPPPLAMITSAILSEVPFRHFNKFEISHDSNHATPNLILTPDIALCDACTRDLKNATDRRYSYPFTSCSQCGPRYSIINSLPYDRVNTQMDIFKMCSSCSNEYYNKNDRRYYAQTNSCPDCAIQLTLYKSNGYQVSSDTNDIIEAISQLWKDGKIIAIKGIGGYLLTCDSTNSTAIRKLRKLKHRPTKPFAVMVPNMASLHTYDLSPEAAEALTNHISPIVLIPIPIDNKKHQGICDHHDHIGIMLPYAPIFKVLLEKHQQPIIATSGNISNSPISYRDEDVFEELSEITDYILTNNREITTPQDDSVVRFTELYKQKIILRRSRGLAPTYINPNLKWTDRSIIATGAQLKSTFSILHRQNIYISQYLGDLDNYATTVNYERTLGHLLQLLKVTPHIILSDDHRDYASTRHGLSCSKRWEIPIRYVQHHLAHFSAILGEHNLMNSPDRVLGVIWDGAGLGTDNCIWGSEFFIYENYTFARSTHLSYFENILGDKMAKEPRLSALAMCFSIDEDNDIIKSKFTNIEWRNYTQIIKNGGLLQSSSMGRLFDAVASLLGIRDKQSFEGEASMLLEVMARRFSKKDHIKTPEHCYNFSTPVSTFSTKGLLSLILKDLKDKLARDLIAFKFHNTLVQWIKSRARDLNCNKIAFSGGVFQNSLLVDLLIDQLSKDYNLHFHKQLSPNDENISFGQLIYHQIEQERVKNA